MRDMRSIAVVGMSGRLPGAVNVEQFWDNLCAARDCTVPLDDADLAGLDPRIAGDPKYVRRGAALEDIENFDQEFFEITPAEAELMDPQHRIFLECAWAAFEDAGYPPGAAAGCCGVFAGSSPNSYAWRNLAGRREAADVITALQIQVATDKDHLSTRVAYKLNLNGPAITVQTACSTGLVAVDLACLHLLHRRCDVALAGAVAISVLQRRGYLYAEGGILSRDGHCRAFDERAGGTVFGNGAGVVLLKRLADALRDGDHIRAVILGSAVNNDGSAKVGYTAPSVVGQAEVIALAQAVAGVEPDSIGYVEAHGTGTPLGDPIEVEALRQAFQAGTKRRGFCALGSVKTNIGHLEAAAGMAGLIKTVLCLERERIPPSLHFIGPNPRIDFDSSPFYVNTELREWKRGSQPRRAGVSAFGIGGTNAHVVLEEAPRLDRTMMSGVSRLLVLSAKTEGALEEMTVRLADYLEQHGELDLGLNLGDVAYTLQVGRAELRWRRMLVCSDMGEAVRKLRSGAEEPSRARQGAGGARSAFEVAPRDGQAESRPGERLGAVHAVPVQAQELEMLGERWLNGFPVDWLTLYPSECPQRVPLPTYPFARRRCWIDPPEVPLPRDRATASHGNGACERITEIWRLVLGHEEISASDDFFALGGDSLVATELVARISTEFGIDLPLTQLAESPTISGITQVVEEMRK